MLLGIPSPDLSNLQAALRTRFPLIHRYGDAAECRRLGYLPLAISAFPRFLREDEELPRPLTFREIRTGAEEARYLAVEAAFWALHVRLARRGFWRVRIGGDLVRMNGGSRRFADLWRASRREFRPRQRFIELYYEEYDVRLVQNWDLTDWAFFRDAADRSSVERIVREVGLFVPE